jgi:hypothetical protein
MTDKPVSRRKPKAERREHEFYPTDPRVCECALSLLPAPTHDITILDPGCGTGVWIAAARKVWSHVRITAHGVDLVNRLPNTMGLINTFWRADLLMWAKGCKTRYDYIIGNLPFDKAEPILWLLMPLMKPDGHQIQLLPSEFSGSKTRSKGLFQIHPYRHEFKLTSRLDFTGGTGDMRWHSLFWWDAAFKPIRDPRYGVMATHSWADWKTPNKQLQMFGEVA